MTVVKHCLMALSAVAHFATAVHAQSYPTRPIRMVVPTSPGGVTDVAARAIAPALSQALGQSVVIDNRAGAGGVPGTDTVAKAAPDGHTLLAVFDSFISNPHVFRNAPYDTIRDFAPISLLIRGPQLVVVHPSLGVRTFGEFLAQAKSRRTPLNYATAGAATSSRLSVELFRSTAKVDATLVHYKGGGPALNDLLGGERVLSRIRGAVVGRPARTFRDAASDRPAPQRRGQKAARNAGAAGALHCPRLRDRRQYAGAVRRLDTRRDREVEQADPGAGDYRRVVEERRES